MPEPVYQHTTGHGVGLVWHPQRGGSVREAQTIKIIWGDTKPAGTEGRRICWEGSRPALAEPKPVALSQPVGLLEDAAVQGGARGAYLAPVAAGADSDPGPGIGSLWPSDPRLLSEAPLGCRRGLWQHGVRHQGKVTVKYDHKELRKRLNLEEWISEQLPSRKRKLQSWRLMWRDGSKSSWVTFTDPLRPLFLACW